MSPCLAYLDATDHGLAYSKFGGEDFSLFSRRKASLDDLYLGLRELCLRMRFSFTHLVRTQLPASIAAFACGVGRIFSRCRIEQVPRFDARWVVTPMGDVETLCNWPVEKLEDYAMGESVHIPSPIPDLDLAVTVPVPVLLPFQATRCCSAHVCDEARPCRSDVFAHSIAIIVLSEAVRESVGGQ